MEAGVYGNERYQYLRASPEPRSVWYRRNT
jgi:hypothetical protein